MTATPGGTATSSTSVPTTMCVPPGGELATPTMKVRRRPVLRAHADRLDAPSAEH